MSEAGSIRLRVVLDTNILVCGLVNPRSASGRVLQAAEERRIIVVLSRRVVKEYREILAQEELVGRYPQLRSIRVSKAIDRLRYVGDIVRSPRQRFDFARDPDDAKFIELLIAGRASKLVTYDPDFLDLRKGQDDASKRFRQRLPGVEIIKPEDLIHAYAREMRIN